ncbi:MAG: DUF2703 domain-containing protein [Acidobacteria bacterium]|nr:DUF2703 domain-containing protein [Acidobacteriota bacterium]
MKIELLYFDGCPSYQQALQNLKEVLVEEGLDVAVELVPVSSPEEAKARRFLGSPTIQIDGVDLEGPEAVGSGIGFGCRVYAHDGHLSGWPSKEHIRAALARRLSSMTSQPTEYACCHTPESD